MVSTAPRACARNPPWAARCCQRTARSRDADQDPEQQRREDGERVRDERGVGFYQEIGRKGGELGGRKGGEAVRDKYGPSFYEEIGRKGGQKVRELIEQGKKRIL